MRAVNNIIILNRGDTCEFSLTIPTENHTTGSYQLQGNDVVYFYVMQPGQPFEEAIIQKSYTVEDMLPDSSIRIELISEDTINLLPGKYFYTVKLHKNHIVSSEDDDSATIQINKMITVINKTKFIICD